MTAPVCTAKPEWRCATHGSVNATKMVDSRRPENASNQNGSTSRHGWLAPRLPQVQRRLSSYEGTVATQVARMFAAQATIPKPTVAIASVVTLITVVTTDTLMHRVSLVTRQALDGIDRDVTS